MSQLDRHVAWVRSKLTASLCAKALGWALLGYVSAVWLLIVIQRVVHFEIHRRWMYLLVGFGVCTAGSFIYAMVRRPSATHAAAAIDQALALKERFSSALYLRGSSDPFAMAVVKDAESVAGIVSLHNRFPVQFPRQTPVVLAIALLAFLTAQFMPALDWFGSPAAKAVAKLNPQNTVNPVKPVIGSQLPKIDAAPKSVVANEQFQLAKKDLERALNSTTENNPQAKSSAIEALQKMKSALEQEIDTNKDIQQAEHEKKLLNNLPELKDDNSPMAKVHSDLKSGDYDKLANDMDKALNAFNQMPAEEQKKLIEQAQQIAAQLNKAANPQQAQQQIQQQLQQMGASAQQAQQMAQALQQAAAAQGTPQQQQTQQQMQQMAQQVAQQMNNGQGPSKQQMQQVQQMMAQMQGVAGAQAQALALSGNMQQIAAALQQAHAAQQGQMAPGQKSGQQPGQQNNQAAQAQLKAAQKQMQQQMQQLQANAKDAQAMKDAQQAAQTATQQLAQSMGQQAGGADQQAGGQGQQNQPGGGQQQANGQGQANNPGGSQPGNGNQGGGGEQQAQAGNGQKPGQGGEGGQGTGGGQMPIAVAPSQMKQEVDTGTSDENGRMLASRYVKGRMDSGQSKLPLQKVALNAEQEAQNEIDMTTIPREAQEAFKDYFTQLQRGN